MRVKQVQKDHYRFARYSSSARWGSYYWQLGLIDQLSPRSVLEIGVGDGVFGRYVKDIMGLEYTSLDIDRDLKPDVVGDIAALPFPDDSFDVICVFQVLEHLPFESVAAALKELKRVARKHIVVSVPDRRPFFQILLKIPFMPRWRFLLKMDISRPGVYGRQHFWEIGWDQFTLKRVRSMFSESCSIIQEVVPFENPHHHFFVLKKES